MFNPTISKKINGLFDEISRCLIGRPAHSVSVSIYIWWRHQMETFSALLAILRGIHRSPVNSLHKGQWRGALMFSLICVWINGWSNNREAGDLRRYRAHYDVTVMNIFPGIGIPVIRIHGREIFWSLHSQFLYWQVIATQITDNLLFVHH